MYENYSYQELLDAKRSILETLDIQNAEHERLKSIGASEDLADVDRHLTVLYANLNAVNDALTALRG